MEKKRLSSMSYFSRSDFLLFFYNLYIYSQIFSESQFIYIKVINRIIIFCRYFSLVGICLTIFWQNKIKSGVKSTLLIISLLISFISLLFFDGGLSIIPVVLIIISSRGIKLEKLFKSTIFDLILSTLFIMVCARVGILKDTVDIRYIGSLSSADFLLSGQYIRHNMGFLVHNQIPLALFCIYVLSIACFQEKLNIFVNIGFLILNWFAFIFFGSRVVFLINNLAFISFYVVKFSSKRKKVIGLNFEWLLFPICAIVSFFASVTYDSSSKVSQIMDIIFNSRLHLAKQAIDFFGIKLFGSGQFAGTYNSTLLKNNTVDNGYVAVFIQTGLIVGLLILLMWSYLTYNAKSNYNKYIVLALLLIALENLINNHLISFKMIPFCCMLLNEKDNMILRQRNKSYQV